MSIPILKRQKNIMNEVGDFLFLLNSMQIKSFRNAEKQLKNIPGFDEFKS